jgi:hypothetical protein
MNMGKEKTYPSLKAMAEAKVEGISKETIFKVDPYSIKLEEGFNPRFETPRLAAYIEALYQAMKAGAFVPPIDLRVIDGEYLATEGHCRTRAARRLVDEGQPYMLTARQIRGNEIEQSFHVLGSDTKLPLTPLESGIMYARLVRYGVIVAEICRRTGFSRTTVDNGIILAEAPVAIHDMLNQDLISTQVALGAIARHGARAVGVLQALVAGAQKAGIKKVTPKHATGTKVPQKAALAFLDAARAVRGTMSSFTMEDIMATPDDMDILVPAKEIKALMAAYAAADPKKGD